MYCSSGDIDFSTGPNSQHIQMMVYKVLVVTLLLLLLHLVRVRRNKVEEVTLLTHSQLHLGPGLANIQER